MTFLVQTLPKYAILFASITAPVIKGEPHRIYRALEMKLNQRSDHEAIHVVMDLTDFDLADKAPINHYVAIFATLYEKWHYQRTITLWISVDKAYQDVVNYLIQTLCIPVYVCPSRDDALIKIYKTYGKTEPLPDLESQK
ncbi:MAG: hypothetical protein WBC91_00360 [Phototrophicaceae bacterium]